MYFVHLYGLHVYCALVDLDSSGFPGVRPTPGLTSSTQVVCVCVRVYTSTHTPTTLTTAKIEKIIRQTPYLYLCQKYSLPHQHQSLTINKLGRTPTSNPLPHTHAGVETTPVIHTHVVDGLDSTNKQNAPTRVQMYTHTRVHMHVYAYIYTDTHICIYIHMHMHIYTHTCTHLYTYMYTHIFIQTENLRNDASTRQRISHTYTHICTRPSLHRHKISATTPQRGKQYHRRTYAPIYICMHIHIYMHIHICAQPAANVSQMCTLMSQEHLYNVYHCTCTGVQNTCSRVHATLTAKICTYIYTYTHMHTHTYAHENACASMTPSKHAEERLL